MNKFLKITDEKIDGLPPLWWSRPYEYAFCKKYFDKKNTILDAGCGIEHPFKWFAQEENKKVYAVDHDPRLLDLKQGKSINGEPLTLEILDKFRPKNDKVEYICEKLGYIKDLKADTIFCISVLEHLTPEMQHKTIENFSELLKPGGKLIITADYPTAKPINILNIVKEYFNTGVPEYEPDHNDNIIMPYFNLKVFTVVAESKVKPKKEGGASAESSKAKIDNSIDNKRSRTNRNKKLSKS